ncbi:MAG: hypothetical protein NW206_02895 [Hyphomonadaceae bacterium]|nr:hypothetical protein [Hyphomonadaceae bacterium]
MDDMQLPAPPLPAACNTRGVGDFSLKVLRRSALDRIMDDTAFRAAFNLLQVAWHQDDAAASLPDDDVALAAWARLGHGKLALRRWLKMRDEALKGWIKCADGRLYEPNLAAEAFDLWTRKLCQQARQALKWNDAAAIARVRQNLEDAHAAVPRHSNTKALARRWLDKLDPNLARRVAAGRAALRALAGGRQ